MTKLSDAVQRISKWCESLGYSNPSEFRDDMYEVLAAATDAATDKPCPHCHKPTRPMTTGEKMAEERIDRGVDSAGGYIRIYGKPDVYLSQLRNDATSYNLEATIDALKQNYAAAIDEAIKEATNGNV